MATWKKIITSGSSAELSSLTLDTALPVAQGGIGATSLTDKAVLISQDSGTDAVGALALNTNGNIIVGGTNGPAVEAASDVAGTGLDASVGDGTLAINVAAAQTSITSILATDIKIGEDDQTMIDFETANEIHFDVNNSELFNMTGNQLSGWIVSTGSFGSLIVADKVQGNLTVDATGSAGYLTAPEISGSFVGDGSNLTGVSQDIDTLDAFSGVPHATDDEFLISDDGTEKRATMTMVANGAFALVSGEATIAAGGALTIAANVIGNNELKQDDDITLQALTTTNNLVVGGDLTVNGTTTTVATTNTKVEDQLMFLATGSAATNVDAGIMVQSGSVDLSGSALYHDINVVAGTNPNGGRWSVAKSVGQDVGAVNPLQFVTTVKTETVNPNSTSGSYGAGEMHVNTTTGDIWIRYG